MGKKPRPRRRTNAQIAVGGGLGGALATVIVWGADTFFGMTIPTNVASAMAFLMIAFGGWVSSKIK